MTIDGDPLVRAGDLRVAASGPLKGIGDLAAELRDIVSLEISLGNRVVTVDTSSNGTLSLVVYFERPLHFREMEQRLLLHAGVSRQRFDSDKHYPVEAGVVAEAVRQALVGPVR